MTESLVLYGTTNEHKNVQTEVAQVNIHLISGHLCWLVVLNKTNEFSWTTQGRASNTYIIDMSFPRIPIICAIFRKFAKPIFQSKRIGDKSYGD